MARETLKKSAYFVSAHFLIALDLSTKCTIFTMFFDYFKSKLSFYDFARIIY